MTIAWAVPAARLRRLMVTLGPTKRLRVKTPAAGTGRAAAMTTKSSVVSLTPMLATWQPNPAGSSRVTTPEGSRSAVLIVRKMRAIAAMSSRESRSMMWRRTLSTWSGATFSR